MLKEVSSLLPQHRSLYSVCLKLNSSFDAMLNDKSFSSCTFPIFLKEVEYWDTSVRNQTRALLHYVGVLLTVGLC